MAKERRRKSVSVTSLDAKSTLYEVGSRDVWQAEVVLQGGRTAGRVIRQVIEPKVYTVRYLVVYLPEDGRHVVVPSSAVVDITQGRVHTDLTFEQMMQLPTFRHEIDRAYEETVYEAVSRTPHWVEEAPFLENED